MILYLYKKWLYKKIVDKTFFFLNKQTYISLARSLFEFKQKYLSDNFFNQSEKNCLKKIAVKNNSYVRDL